MHAPVFIVGCGRSGTTLLKELLNHSKEIYIPKESAFIPELYERSKEYSDFSTREGRMKFIKDLKTFKRTRKDTAFEIFEMEPQEVNEVLAENSPMDYAEAVSVLFEQTANENGKKVWGDKTPLYTLYVKLIHELFPDARIVHLLRDPRDVSKSIKNVGWALTLKEAALMWKKQVRKGIAGRKLDDLKYYEIKYESLLLNPEKEPRKLFKWLDFNYPDDLLERYLKRGRKVDPKYQDIHQLIGKSIQKSKAYSWKKNMKKANIALIEEVVKEEIQKTDYELTNFEVPLTRRISSSILEKAIPLGRKIKRKITL